MSKQSAVIIPLAADYAFPNSLKGQRGCILPYQKYQPKFGEKYVRLVKIYFNWDELERTKADGVERIRQVTDKRLAGCREANIRYIPRVAIQWPNHGDHTLATKVTSHCAADMLPSTLDTPEFLARVRNLVEKMGEAWDEDPRIAYLETGIYGLWGEEHEDIMSRKAQKNMADAYHKAFKKTPCMIRIPRDCIGQGFGTYWDSFAHINEEHHAADAVNFMDWHIAVMGGEVAHNWGDYKIQPGDDMNDTLTAPEHRERFLDYVYWQHNNHLGIRMQNPDERTEAAFQGLAEYQKRAGHRLNLEKFTYELDGSCLRIAFDVKNVGASPLYHKWPVAAALLNEEKQPVWQKNFTNADVTGWYPGDHWNFEKRAYDLLPEIYHVQDCFSVDGVPEGKYYLALSILDPYCGRPGVLFATRQYFNGGWHPMGYVGIGCTIENAQICEALFDDQRTDTTITY